MIHIEKANILVDALPYIYRHKGKTFVVKYGGSAMKKEGIKDFVIEDLLLMSHVGINIVLVHGGGAEIDEMLSKLNIKCKFVDGMRYTDEDTMKVVQMVLAGKVNKELTGKINLMGGNAVGLCGVDDKMLMCKPFKNYELGFVGEIEKVNTKIIKDCLDSGYISVIATIGLGENGETYNINGDTAASVIAKELNADKLILLTDVPGLLKDPNEEKSLISHVSIENINMLFEEGVITGGMIPKINGCVDAIKNGVNRVHILDGRVPHSMISELFTPTGVGTLLHNESDYIIG